MGEQLSKHRVSPRSLPGRAPCPHHDLAGLRQGSPPTTSLYVVWEEGQGRGVFTPRSVRGYQLSGDGDTVFREQPEKWPRSPEPVGRGHVREGMGHAAEHGACVTESQGRAHCSAAEPRASLPWHAA